MRSCAIRPECKMHIHANAQHRFIVVVCWLLSLFVLMCSNHQLAQKEKILKEEVEEMKATLSCTEEGRARASAHSKHVVSQTRAARGESIKMLSACKQMACVCYLCLHCCYPLPTLLYCQYSTPHFNSNVMNMIKSSTVVDPICIGMKLLYLTFSAAMTNWGTLTSITHCGWKWFRQSNPKSKDCIQTLDKWENSLSRDVSRKPSTLLHSESSFPPLLLIAFLLFRREKTRVSLPRLLLFRKRYLTVQRGLLSEELTVKSMTWLWRAQ